MLESKGRTGTIQTRSSHISEKIWQSIHPRKIRLWRKRTTERRPYRLWRGETQSGVSPSVGRACCSVAPWLRKFGSIHLRNVGTTSCKNVETLPLKNNLSRFKSLLVTGLWDITLTYLLSPIKSCSCKFWAWSCIVSNFAKGWRGDHKHKIMDRPLIPKYGTPFPCANSTRACSDHLTFTELTLLAKPKVFIRRNVGPPCRVTQPSQKDDQARRVTLLDKSTFLFLM